MKMTPLIGLALAAALAPGLAQAQPGSNESGFVADRFAELDTNSDGVISQREVEAQIADAFASADTDGNGTLSEDEAAAFHQARREERRERRRASRSGGHFERVAGDDGVIDSAEFTERGMERFERADLDENGQITETEMELIAGFMERRHQRGHRGRRGE